MDSPAASQTSLEEHAGYLAVPGAHLYTVLHRPADPVARVLLVGPFASERQFAYQSWVRWARYLAARGIEAVRYDYRGVGESTGTFEEMNFDDWSKDVATVAGWVAERHPALPLVLHGLELGAILAAREFTSGTGDALLLWSPPTNANQALRSILRRWAGMEQLYESPANRKSASEYIRELEQGQTIEVHGYLWSSKLWRDSFHFKLPDGLANDWNVLSNDGRPVDAVSFGRTDGTLGLPYRRYNEEQDLKPLYSQALTWISEALHLELNGFDETSH